MGNTPHELAADFPELTDRIHALKEEDAHFAKQLERYHEVNRLVHGAETNVAPMDSLAETELRKERAHLKDQLYRRLTESA